MVLFLTLAALILLVVGWPIWLIFLATSIASIAIFTNIPLNVVVSTLVDTLDNLVLLAVPGFIFAGVLMERGGMTVRTINWVRSLVGPIPGGTPLAVMGAAELFGAMSGSSAASTAALGKVLYPALRQSGYSERFSLGLISSSGCLATVIPPSITMILFSAVTGASLGTLFLAGFLPGTLMALSVGCYSIYVSFREKGHHDLTWNRAAIAKATIQVLWTLGLPIIIFGGIYGGFVTPTEASVLAATYALIIASLIHHELNWKDIGAVALEAAMLTSKIFVITAAAGLFTWVLTISHVPQALVSLVQGADIQPWMVLAAINLLLIIAGMFIDPASNVLVLAPLLWPIAKLIEVDLIHFGIIVTVNMAIGMISPPFGLNLFVSSSVLGAPMGRLAVSVMPFFFIYVMSLMLITYMPGISLWLPSLLGR